MTDSPRRRDATANRDALVLAARQVLSLDPFASIDTIARSAGLTRRAVYGHFADRDELVAHVIARGSERFNRIADSVAPTPPVRALATLALRLWDEAAHMQANAAVALDRAHAAETARALAPLRTRLREIGAAGIRAGDFRDDTDAEGLARLIEAGARGVIATLDSADPASRTMAGRAILGIAGLDWRTAGREVDLVDAAETAGVSA